MLLKLPKNTTFYVFLGSTMWGAGTGSHPGQKKPPRRGGWWALVQCATSGSVSGGGRVPGPLGRYSDCGWSSGNPETALWMPRQESTQSPKAFQQKSPGPGVIFPSSLPAACSQKQASLNRWEDSGQVTAVGLSLRWHAILFCCKQLSWFFLKVFTVTGYGQACFLTCMA